MTIAKSSPADIRRSRGLTRDHRADPIGRVVAGLNKLAQTPALDRWGLRRSSEQMVFSTTRTGYRTAAAVTRQFAKAQRKGPGVRVPDAERTDLFDLRPTEDEQMLVDVVTELASEVLRPAAAEADSTCQAPVSVLKAGLDLGLPVLGVDEDHGGIATHRSTVAGVLVAEALAHGDLGLAVASLAPGSVATAISLWGSAEQQAVYLPAFAGDDVPVAALALAEPTALFDPLRPATTAERVGSTLRLNGVKSGVPRGAEAELFIVGAMVDGKARLILMESATPGLAVEADPSMGVRAAGLTRLHLNDVVVEQSALLGDAESYVEAVRLSRLAWCGLALGTAQAVLDYVGPYVRQRKAFGEPIAYRQSVAFMVANIAIELEGMRLVTYRAAARAAQGKSCAREIALARRLCSEHGMRIGLDGVQLLGGHGFVKEHPVERWYRDLRAISLMEGAVLV